MSLGLRRTHFRPIARNGFGDPYNSYPHSMCCFGGDIYVGTTRAVLAHRGRYVGASNEAGVGEVWPVPVAEGPFDIDLNAEIWRYRCASDTWQMVHRSPCVKGQDGSDVPRSLAFRAMTVFQGRSDPAPALYVPTMGSHQTPWSLMLRTEDGSTFHVASDPGMGFAKPYWPRGVRGITPFKDRLFAAPAVGKKKSESNTAGFMVIGVTDDPVFGEWQLACEPCFGDPNNMTAFDITAFHGHLYAGTLNVAEGFQVWKTEAEGRPPYSWKQVLRQGAFRGKRNQIAMTLHPFQEALYVGTAVQGGGFDYENQVGPAAFEIIRIYPDDSWELIVGEPRLTPDGLKVPLSGLGPGFDNARAGYLWSMCVHEGWLYAGTYDWLLSLRYRPGRWAEHIRKLDADKTIDQSIAMAGGCDLWRSRDGVCWVPVTQNGFDNEFNYGIRRMTSTERGLFVATANPFGPKVAVKRITGWRYEDNPRGGCEVWLGSSTSAPGVESSQSACERLCIHLQGSGIDGTRDLDLDGLIHAFYDGHGYRHFGFWGPGIRTITDACDNLMEEVLSLLPEGLGSVVDLCCGLGATTCYLLKHYPAKAVQGFTTRDEYLAECRNRSKDITFCGMDRHRVRGSPNSIDAVIWLKGLTPMVPRGPLIREAIRILSPGGRLACFDVVKGRQPNAPRRWTFGRTRHGIRTIDEYRGLLTQYGFEHIQTYDVTSETLRRFLIHAQRYLVHEGATRQYDDSLYDRLDASLMMKDALIDRCFIISAAKPR